MPEEYRARLLPNAPSEPATPERVPVSATRPFIRLRALIDCRDHLSHWHEAEVVIFTAGRVFVHYTYWSSQWDEWIDVDSERLQPRGTYVFLTGTEARLGQFVDAYDSHPEQPRGGAWEEARVVDARPGHVLVKFKHISPARSAWYPSTGSDRLAQWGTKTRERQPYRPRSKNYWEGRARGARFGGAAVAAPTGAPPLPEAPEAPPADAARPSEPQQPQLSAEQVAAQFRAYAGALGRTGLAVVPMGGDGNCLFRAVAHQVYGDQELHRVTRCAAADYMEAERAWFSAFVVGDASEFGEYVAAIRRDAVWGDDPEIQAMCELYDRPAEIYAYDPVAGARKLRVFHSARADARPPIRLSYFGGGHYDSVVGPGWQENLLVGPVGAVEALRIAAARSATAAAARGGDATAAALEASDVASTEEATVAAALRLSREEFDASAENLDAALLRVELAVPPAAGVAAGDGAAPASGGAASSSRPAALQPSSSANAAGAAALAAAAPDAVTAPGAGVIAQPPLPAAAAGPSLESQILQHVMEASAAAAEAVSLEEQTVLLERSRATAEEESLRAAIEASIAERGGGALVVPVQGHGNSSVDGAGSVAPGGVAASDDDLEMQAALAMSLGRSAGPDPQSQPQRQVQPAPPGELDALYNLGLDLSEDQQLARLLQLSADEEVQRARRLQLGPAELRAWQQGVGQQALRLGLGQGASAPGAAAAAAPAAVGPAAPPPEPQAAAASAAADPNATAFAGEEEEDDEVLQAALAASLQPL